MFSIIELQTIFRKVESMPKTAHKHASYWCTEQDADDGFLASALLTQLLSSSDSLHGNRGAVLLAVQKSAVLECPTGEWGVC